MAKNLIASHYISVWLAMGYLGCYLNLNSINWTSQLCFLHNQNLIWNGWDMTKIKTSWAELCQVPSSVKLKVMVWVVINFGVQLQFREGGGGWVSGGWIKQN